MTSYASWQSAQQSDPSQAAAYAAYPDYSAYSAYAGYPATYGYPGYQGYQPEAQPPAPGSGTGHNLASAASEAAPPLPPDEAPPGASAHGSSSDASADTVAPPPPPAAPQAAAATATAYADQAAYQQWYSNYYAAYGAYPSTQTGAYPQAGTYPAGAYPQAGTYAQSQEATQGYAAVGSEQARTLQSASSMPYASPQGTGYPQAQQQPMQQTVTSPRAVPGPRPPPGEPPPGTGMPRQSSGSYNAVAPPPNLTGSNRQPITIRPQYNVKPNAPAQRQPITMTSQARPSYTPATPAAAPAFLRAGVSPAAAPARPAAPPANPPGAGASKFPPAFNTWVERCFERCRTDSERQAMTGRLTACIKSAEAKGSLWGVNWDKEPIPNLNAPESPATSFLGQQDQGGLRSKRSRWEESNAQQQQQQPQQQQQQGNKKWQNGQFQKQNGKAQQGQKQNQGQAKKQKLENTQPVWSQGENNRRAERAGRFGSGRATGRNNSGGYDGGYDSDESAWSEDAGFGAGVVVQGTAASLEKSYFRLTGPPDPTEVRPPPVLRRALDRLVGMLHRGVPQANHFYTVDQFKGLRQDCTVQHLRNELAVAVYEAHARSSLEYGDLAEFNQCQTQLASMYAEGIPGCVAEFTAYKLLYNVAHARSGAIKALLHTLRTALATQQSQVPDPHGAIPNAHAARAAIATNNFPAFFAAYARAPALGRAILDVLVPHVRWAALNVLVKAYKTSLPLAFVARALGFVGTKAVGAGAAAGTGKGAGKGAGAGGEGELPLPGCRQVVYAGKAAAADSEEEGVKACAEWLEAHGAVLEAAGTASPMLDVKQSMGKLFIPEEPKVSHGDDNLSLEDFLSRASGLKC